MTTPVLINDYKKAFVPTSALPSAGAGYFRLVQRFASQLQMLLPGETNAPNTLTGKIGTLDPQTVGTPFNLRINACDATWHIAASCSDTVAITSSDTSAGHVNDTALVNGTVTISDAFYFGFSGTWTVTATDATTNTVSASTSSPITIP